MSEQTYLDLARTILETGHYKEDRTNTGTYSLFGYQMRFDLNEGFSFIDHQKSAIRVN